MTNSTNEIGAILSVEQAARASSLSKPFLRREIRLGRLRAVRPGGGRRVLIMREDFMRFLDSEAAESLEEK